MHKSRVFGGHKRATKHLRVVYTFYTRGELFTLMPAFPFGLRTPNLHIRYFPRANYRGMIGHYFCTNPCIVPANPLGFDWPPFIPSL